MRSGSQDILVSDHDSTSTKSLTAGVLEERGLQHRPPADPKDSWDLPNRIGTRPPPQTAMWTLETGKEHIVKVTVSEQFHCLDWWGDTLKEQVESYSFYAMHYFTWTALLMKVARSLSGRPSVWGANQEGRIQLYKDQPSNCSWVMPCHALPMQQSHRGRRCPGGMQVHVLGQVSASHVLLWKKHIIETFA